MSICREVREIKNDEMYLGEDTRNEKLAAAVKRMQIGKVMGRLEVLRRTG